METESSMVPGSENREADLSPQISSLIPLHLNVSSVGAAIAVDVAGCSLPGNSLSEPKTVFMIESSESCSVFDCSSLTGVLSSECFAEGEQDLEDEPTDVFDVPWVTRSVVISKQMILKEIVRCLHLKVHESGISYKPDGILRGWMELDMPRHKVGVPRLKKKFVVANASNRYNAMEKVSEVVIQDLCSNHGVIVKYVSYPEVIKIQSNLNAAKDLSDLFSSKLQQRIKQDEVMQQGYANLVDHAKSICMKFKDVLPVKTVGEEDLVFGMASVRVLYNGPRRPVSHMEELAFDLMSLVNKSADLGVIARQLDKMDQGSSKRKRCHIG